MNTTDTAHTTVVLSARSTRPGRNGLHELLYEAAQDTNTNTVSFAGAQFIDSTVIGTLVIAHAATATGRRFTIATPGSPIRRGVQMTGVLYTLATDSN